MKNFIQNKSIEIMKFLYEYFQGVWINNMARSDLLISKI